MKGKLSERFTYANVASTLALIIAVGGGGVAVAAVAVNSVGSPQIIDGAVKTRDLGALSVSNAKLKDNAVGPAKVIDNSLKSEDIRDNVLTSTDVMDDTLQHSDFFSGKLGVVRAYAWISNSNTPLDTPTLVSNSYTYNSAGGDITVNHTADGVYNVAFAGLNILPGHVQVTSYGSAVTWCKVSSWGGSSATVRCFNAAGAPANSLFAIAMIE